MARPILIDEAEEREELKEWNWDYKVEKSLVEDISLNAANVILDQIKSEARLSISFNEETRAIESAVTLFGDYCLYFDISGDLAELAEYWVAAHRKLWESEIEGQEEISNILRSIADKIDANAAEQRARGTLDEEKGMNYEDWRKANPIVENEGWKP